MIELIAERTRTSKVHLLESLPDGRRRYAIDARTYPLHYQADPKVGGDWLDIDTSISADGKVTAAPYDLSVYLTGLPGFRYVSKHSGELDIKLAGAIKSGVPVATTSGVRPVINGNQVIWPNYWPDVDVILTATPKGVGLYRIIKSVTAARQFDVVVTEIAKGQASLVPIPPAMDALGRRLKMEAANITGGRREELRLELEPIQFADPKPAIAYPIVDATIIDEQVGASGDDGMTLVDISWFSSGLTTLEIGHNDSNNSQANSFYYFPDVDIAQGVTIDSAKLVCYEAGSDAGALTKIFANDSAGPTAPTDVATHNAKVRTTAGIDWDGDPGAVGWQDSPSIVSVLAELVNDYTITSLLILHDDDGSAGGGSNRHLFRSYDYTGNVSGPKVYIEYTAGGGGGFAHSQCVMC